MEKKDVLFICQFYSPEYVTSASLAADTCEAVTTEGLSVDVLCGYPSEYVGSGEGRIPSKEIREGVGVRRLKYLTVSRKSAPGRLINYFSFYNAVLFRLFSMRKYRIIAAYSNPPMVTNILNLAARLFKVKTVFIAHDVYPEIAIKTGKTGKKGLMAKTMSRINRRLAKVIDGVVCISGEMADHFEKVRRIPREKIAAIPNWHKDLDCAAPEDHPDRPFTCGYFGNMGICQDMETIVSAIGSIPEDRVNFVFAGHGSKIEDIKKKIGDKANVTIRGFLRGEEYRKALEECDAFIVSLKEGLGGLCAPSKVYSYYMAGRPVIAVTDEKDILNDLEKYGCGIGVKNGDGEGLAKAVEKLSSDRELSRRMGESARRCYLENYTPEICCGKLGEYFKNTLKK